MDFVLNTSSDSKYFSRVLNLIFSVKFYSSSVKFKVWDLGLTKFQKFILHKLGLELVNIPPCCNFWNKCYTWKPYIYKFSEDKIFFYLDAGCSVHFDIVEIFEILINDNFFFVNQGQKISNICPSDYVQLFGLKSEHLNSLVFAAGIIGFNKNSKLVKDILDITFEHALNGKCLGYSKSEISLDTNKIGIIRDCDKFRHDQTVINCVVRTNVPEIVVQDASLYASLEKHIGVKIHNHRKVNYEFYFLNKSFLKYLLFCYCFINDFFYKIYDLVIKILFKLNNQFS